MKKNIIALIGLAVLLAGALAAFLLLQSEEDSGIANREESSSAQDVLYVMGGFPKPFVKTVAIQNNLGTYTIRNGHQNQSEQDAAEAPDFSIDGIDSESLNASTLQGVMTAAASLTAKKMVAADGDLAPFGLDNPRATVKAVYDEGSSEVLIGDNAPGGEGVYVLSGGQVYLVAASSVSNMLLSRLDYVSKTITPGSAQTASFEEITLTGENLPEPVVIRKSPEDDEAAMLTGIGAYHIESPVRAGVDFTRGLIPLLGVFGLTAETVIAEAGGGTDPLSTYGLLEPYVTARVQTGDPETGDFTLAVSAPDAGGNIYLKSSAKPFIYRMAAGSIPWLNLTFFDYRDKQVAQTAIGSVSQVEVLEGDAVYLFDLSGEGDSLEVRLGEAVLDTSNFRRFYQTLISASYDSEMEENSGEHAAAGADSAADADSGESPEQQAGDSGGEAAGSVYGNVILQYAYRYRDGSPEDVVRFYPGPARKVIVSLNDGEAYYVKSTYVDRVLEDLAKVAANEEVNYP